MLTCTRPRQPQLVSCCTATISEVVSTSSATAEVSPKTSTLEIPDFHVPNEVIQRNADFAQRVKDQLILAPLTKGGNLPFRRLCVQFGAEVTMSEMAYARMLMK